MRPVDKLKFAVLIVAISIWAWGAKTGNHNFMLAGIGFVVIAFALRLVPHSRDRDDL
jgi:hypothetical protein